jgi:hypothetical protein
LAGVVIAVALHALTAVASAESLGGIGMRLIDVPGQEQSDPRGRLYVVDHVAPGSVIERRIQIANTTASPARVVLYPSAASIQRGVFLGGEGHRQNDLSTWTSVTPDVSDVPAGGVLAATVRVAVPSDAAPGEQYGVVWAETRRSPAEAGFTQVSRVGLRLYVSVGPGGPPAADFTIQSLTSGRAPDGLPLVVATVHNTGGRALDMDGVLQLAGPAGLEAGPFPASLGTTLGIDMTADVTVALDERLPAGPWDAQITLRSGLLERTAQATITFPEVGTASLVPVTAEGSGGRPPLVAGAVVLAALGASGAFLRAQRHRRRRRS